jgi:hypothetical protein
VRAWKLSRTAAGSGEAPTIGNRRLLMSASIGTCASTAYTVGTALMAAIR